MELNLLTGYPTEEIAFQSALVEKTAQPLELVLTVKASLTPRQGDLPLGETVSRSITLALDPVLRLESVSADRARDSGTITLNFSSPVTAREAEDFVTLTPEASHFAQAQGTDLILTGDFLPGADYRVAIRSGLTAADGARLEEEAARTVTIPDIPAQVGFRDQGMFLSRSGLKNLAVESVNLDQTRLTIDRVFENNVFPLFQNYTWLVREGAWPGSEVPHALGDRVVDVTIPLKGSPNQVRTLSLDLEKHLDVSSPGFYKVALQQPGGGPGDMRWVLLTDLGLAVKEGKDGFLVWTVSFATGNPLDNVEVELVSDQNQVLATGRTEGRGLCELSLSPDSADGAKPFLVRARRGDDLSFLVLDRFRDSLTGLEVAGKTLSTKGYTAYIYGERDIYRPGEMVHGLGVVRDARLAPPAPMPLRFELTGPQGRELARWKAGSTRAGLVPFTREIPSFFPTGSYTLNLLAGEESLGSWSFQVEEFVPDRISVRLDPGQESLAPGENATVDIASRYLFGPPAEGLRVRVRATLVERAFSPKGWEQYRFLNPEASFQDMEIAEAETVLDDNGTTGFSFAVPDGLRPPSALSAMVLARVMEHGGRGVAARTMVDVHPYPAYLGLKKLAKQGFDPGEEISFQWAAVAPDGKAAEVPGLKAGFFHDRWQTVVRRGSRRRPDLRVQTRPETPQIPGSERRRDRELHPVRPPCRELSGGGGESADRGLRLPGILCRGLGLVALGHGEPGPGGDGPGQEGIRTRRNRPGPDQGPLSRAASGHPGGRTGAGGQGGRPVRQHGHLLLSGQAIL